MSAAPPGTPFVHHLFSRQAHLRPDETAICFGARRLTYGELEARSNRLAHFLRRLGVGPEVPVAICAERTPERVVGIVAVLKAGGAYVPIDPAYPSERVSYLLQDSRARVLLTEQRFLAELPSTAPAVLCLDLEVERQDGDEAAPPLADLAPESLAYVVYTSGSTGKPKGVAISHRALSNLMLWSLEALQVTHEDRGTLMAGPAFDASVWELWFLLAAGAGIYIPDAETRLSAPKLLRFWADHGITLSFLPTPLAEAVLEAEIPGDLDLRLRDLLVGGDRLHRAPRPGTPFRLVNNYGPSEYSVITTSGTVPPGGRDSTAHAAPPIGRPIAGTRVYLLGAQGTPVAPGEAGELCVAGVGLARGYAGRPDLTAERFVPDSAGAEQGEPGARLYRTGDLVRLRTDGELDFLGRIDHQVKLRGMRVELGEIETVLAHHPRVLKTAMLVREDRPGDQRLVAYTVLRDGERPSAEELGGFLERELPAYMVPQDWVFLAALPLTPNGKVDRGALPVPDRRAAAADAVAPRTPLEELLGGIFCQVLGLSGVGVHDDFFALGGHSLLATQVVSRASGVLGVELEVGALFAAPTIEALARRLEEEGAGAGRAPAPALRPIPRREGEPVPLSHAQARLWFLDQLDPGSPLYNIPMSYRLEGRLDVGALARSLAEIVRRHESLRTRFARRGDEPVQVIVAADRAWPVVLPLIDLSALDPVPRAAEGARLARAEAVRPFDLARAPLARFALVRLATEEHQLFLSMHHSVSDGWSMGLLIRELAVLYTGLSTGTGASPPALSVQYADYALWQREWLGAELLEREVGYWRRRLASAPALLDLPTDRPRPAAQSFRGGTVRWRPGSGLAARIEGAARELGGTPFVVWMAAFQALLARLANQLDVSVGTPFAGRNRTEIEDLIGFFVNTLVLRTSLAGEPSFAELVGRVRTASLEAFAHQHLPFEKLVEALAPERGLSRSPLFQVMLVLVNDPLILALPGLRVEPIEPETGTSKLDLLLVLADQGRGLEVALEYSSDLFDRTTARRLLAQLETLLESALERPERGFHELPLLDGAAQAQVVREWSDTRGPAAGMTQGERFRLQAARHPERPAVSFGGLELTYAELDAFSDRMARWLRRLGIGPGVPVGICLERSLAVPVALLGVLKAGGTLLPLDPAYPVDRLAFMLADAAAPVLLSASDLAGLFPRFAGALLLLDSLEALAADLAAEPAVPFESSAQPEDLAYLIYTSGSTGRPKGVALGHRVLSNLIAFHLERETAGRTLQFTPLSFDVSMQEIFSTWALGGTLVLISDADRRDPETLLGILEGERIERLFLPFVALNHLAEAAERKGARPAALRTVITAGEQLQASEALVAWFRRLGSCTLENHYGPSETHVVTVHRLSPDPGVWAPLPPIGRAILNCRAYLLDARMQPVPIGVPGELFLGGAQVARGYLGRPDLTAERFVPDPFARERGESGERLYRSGDLARTLPDGNLEFLGRIDLQVKVRGFRIELGEIETLLAEHPAIREAVVTAPEIGGLRRLVAYLVPEGEAPKAVELKGYLAARLPEYMVPSHFVALDALPLGATGKVDRRSLPLPEGGREEGEGELVAPRTPWERLVAEVWGQVLGLDRLGVHDNFWDLGGHSLLATKVLARVNAALDAELPLRALFRSPTVAGFAAEIEESLAAGRGETLGALAPVPREGFLPLSFGQQRLWFLDRMEPGLAHYNLPMAHRLRGQLEVAALAAALAEVVRRHEVLRTRFADGAGGPVQIIDPPAAVVLPQVDLGALPAWAREAEERRVLGEEVHRPFDLARGGLLRPLLLRLEGGESVLLLALHHVVTDGWSQGVLLRELAGLYGALAAGGASPLAPLPVQYADYAVWQRGRLESEELERQLAYWRERLAGLPPLLELPTDRPRPAVQTFGGAVEWFDLGADLSARLLDLGRRSGAPLFMVTLAAFTALLQRYAGQTDLAVGTPIAGRSRVELEGLIGFFVNTLVLRTSASGDPTYAELLERTRATALGAYAHADLPFERLVEALAPERDLGRTPLFQVSFLLQAAALTALPRFAGLETEEVNLASESAKFDLTAALFEKAESITGAIEYNLDLFDGTTIRRLASHFRALLAGAAADPAMRLSELPLLSAAERGELFVEWSATESPYPRERSIQSLFLDAARRTPGAVAVIEGEGGWTYAELDELSGALAGRLRAAGVGPDRLVALSVERSFDMVVGMLAILRAGGAYAPIDPTYPKERLEYLLADSGASVLLTQGHLLSTLPAGGLPTILIDGAPPVAESEASPPAARAESGLGAGLGGDRLAYVIYTSGSTGRPKGVAVPHRAVVRLVLNTDYVRLGPGDRVAQAASASFDAATFEIWGALLNGAALVILAQEVVLSPAALAGEIRRQGITSMFLTTALFNQMAREAPGAFEPLRELLFGGEAADPPSVRAVLSERPPRRLLHVYGPTENTTFSTWYEVTEVAGLRSAVPIGSPVANSRSYVLDASFGPVPVGVHGHLFVAGDGLARGYLNRPELTAERFVPDPYAPRPGGRLYATGDLVRLLPGGRVEFLGRSDQQVKIRGFRIELGEIETALARHHEVRQAVVLAHADPSLGKRLVAYLVGAGATPRDEEMRGYLRDSLPDYMVPTAFAWLEELPLTPNGKVDRRALASIEVATAAKQEYVAPETPLERMVAEIWAEVLKVERVGLHDNFWELGGHSLLATKVFGRIKASLEIDLPLRALFKAPTVVDFTLALGEALLAEDLGAAPEPEP